MPCADDVGHAADATVVAFEPGSAWPEGMYRIRIEIDGASHDCEVALPSARTAVESCSGSAALDFLPLGGETRSALAAMFVENVLPTEVVVVGVDREGVDVSDEEFRAWEETTKEHEQGGRVCSTSNFATVAVQLPW